MIEKDFISLLRREDGDRDCLIGKADPRASVQRLQDDTRCSGNCEDHYLGAFKPPSFQTTESVIRNLAKPMEGIEAKETKDVENMRQEDVRKSRRERKQREKAEKASQKKGRKYSKPDGGK